MISENVIYSVYIVIYSIHYLEKANIKAKIHWIANVSLNANFTIVAISSMLASKEFALYIKL